ncbi:MAG: tetratricopeptide repeat protein [Myxococcales bacterium]|nr:tetratricopeptide repeat protein [Myxococcales bacterium]
MNATDGPDLPETHLCCLALVQLVDVAVLAARVPAAVTRSESLVRAAIREAAASAGGEEVTSAARGALVVFSEASAAAKFALSLQEALLKQPWPSTLLVRPEAREVRAADGTVLFRGLRARVGLHVGRLFVQGDRVRGPAVHQVTRITGAAHGGQVLLSTAAWRHLKGVLPGTVVLRDLGAHRVTGMPGVRRLFQLLPLGLDARSFPRPRSQDVRRSNLPPEGEFIGRQQDIASLVELMTMGVRLITVVGAEGVGKSRLVRQLAHVRRSDATLTGGVWLATPASTSVASVVRRVAEALGVDLADAPQADDAVTQVGHALADRGPTLLALDGLRTHDPAVAAAVEAWTTLAPEATLVVSAARRLAVRGEVAYEVGPLSLVETEGVRYTDAVRMFTRRARGVSATFGVGSGDEVARLIAAVGARPRAIRLLAGVADRVEVAALLATLPSEADLAAVSTLAWEALTDSERAVLATCAMHQGGFEAIAPPPGFTDDDVHQLLADLDRRGWLRVAPDPSAPDLRRYMVAPELRGFIRRNYPDSGLAEIRAHRDASLLEEGLGWLQSSVRREEPEVVARLAVEWPNLVQVVLDGKDPARGTPGLCEALRAMALLRPVLLLRGPLFEGIRLTSRLIARCDEQGDVPADLVLDVLLLRAHLLLRAGRTTLAGDDLQRATRLARELPDQRWLGEVQHLQGRVLAAEPERASNAFRQATEVFERSAEPLKRARSLARLALAQMQGGRYDDAEAHLHEAVAVLRDAGATGDEARAVGWLALLYRRSGRSEQARSLYREVIHLLVEEGGTRAESVARSDLAILDYHLGRLDDADRGLEEAAAVARRIGDRRAEAHATSHGGLVALSRGQPQVARQRLLSALAVYRTLRDSAAEGHVTGLLGILHHLSDQLDSAREFYDKALTLLDAAGSRRLQAMFGGWSAAIEAELGHTDAAAERFATAERCHAESSDPQVGEALEQLRGALQLDAARAARQRGAPQDAERLESELEERLSDALQRVASLPGEARLALARVEHLARGDRSRL